MKKGWITRQGKDTWRIRLPPQGGMFFTFISFPFECFVGIYEFGRFHALC